MEILNTKISRDILGIIYKYINYSHDNLTKVYNKNLTKYKQMTILVPDILTIITKCVKNGHAGIGVNTNSELAEHFKKQVVIYNNILQYYRSPYDNTIDIIRLNGLEGDWIHVFAFDKLE
jgi:septum formation topological specificity factor MinE